MSLLSKYLEGKEKLHEEFEEIHKKCDEALDMAGGKFLEQFKEMVAAASDEEFHEFMCESGEELDDIERMAALTARLESYSKRCKEKENDEEKIEKNNDGPHVVIIGIG